MTNLFDVFWPFDPACSLGMTDGSLGADLQFFEALEVLWAMADAGEEVAEEKIIAVAIEHMRAMPYYADLFRQFSFAEEWESRIKDAENRYEAALAVFNDIAEAKEAAQKVKETAVKVDEKITGLSQCINKIRMIVNWLRFNDGFIDALIQNNKFIMLDRDELVKPENRHIMDWIEKISEGREGSPFVYSDEGVPDGVNPEDVIYLLEPEKVDDQLPEDGRLYLPLPYSVSSIYLASQVVLAGGNMENIQDKLAGSTIKALYETLLGREITGEELYKLFRTPRTVLPPIVQITGTLNALRKAIVEIEVAA